MSMTRADRWNATVQRVRLRLYLGTVHDTRCFGCAVTGTTDPTVAFWAGVSHSASCRERTTAQQGGR